MSYSRHGVLIAIDRDESEPVDAFSVAKGAGDGVRLGKVEGDTSRLAAELDCGGSCLRLVPSADRDVRSSRAVRRRERAANARGTPDYDDFSGHLHLVVRSD